MRLAIIHFIHNHTFINTYIHISGVRSLEAVDVAHPANSKMSRVFSSKIYLKSHKISKTLSIHTIQLLLRVPYPKRASAPLHIYLC